MGRKKEIHIKKDGTPFIKTLLRKDSCSICAECPNRLFTDINSIVFGVGSITTNTIFVLPTLEEHYTKNNGILQILENLYEEITGNKLYERVYITFATKCHNIKNYETYQISCKCCIPFISYEFIKIKPTHVIYFGKAKENIITCNNTINYYKYEIINPNVYYTDKNLYEVFKKEFAKVIHYIENININL